jgi:predicted nucleic acid-binding Zn ribbon protein
MLINSTIPRALNCVPDGHGIGSKACCPDCGQFHLRAGYCQALNPKASEAIRSGRRLTLAESRALARGPEAVPTVTPPVTLAPTVTSTVTPEDATVTRVCEACGKAVEGKARYCSGACRMRASRARPAGFRKLAVLAHSDRARS